MLETSACVPKNAFTWLERERILASSRHMRTYAGASHASSSHCMYLLLLSAEREVRHIRTVHALVFTISDFA